jgi:hypothetical protein
VSVWASAMRDNINVTSLGGLPGGLDCLLYCKITYFRWDFISRFYHIVSLQQSKIRVFGRVVIENPLNIFIFAGFIFVIITPSRK